MLMKTLILVGFTLLCGSHVDGSFEPVSPDPRVPDTDDEYVSKILVLLEERGLKVECILEQLNGSFQNWSACSEPCGGGYKTRSRLACSKDDQDNCTETMYCNTQPCDEKRERVATCKIDTDPRYIETYSISGVVTLRQRKGQPLEVTAAISKKSPEGANDKSTIHGFHVHTYGDISKGCAEEDQDFNPDNVTHGYTDSQTRHVGDWGNIELVDKNEREPTSYTFTDKVASLFGDRSIIGRSLVIHERKDDGGINSFDPESKRSGNTGKPVACCVIGLASE